jgi:hypothetical protein
MKGLRRDGPVSCVTAPGYGITYLNVLLLVRAEGSDARKTEHLREIKGNGYKIMKRKKSNVKDELTRRLKTAQKFY